MFSSFRQAASSRWLFTRISCSRIRSPLMVFNCISRFRMSSMFPRILASSKRITTFFRRVALPAASAWSRASTSFKPKDHFRKIYIKKKKNNNKDVSLLEIRVLFCFVYNVPFTRSNASSILLSSSGNIASEVSSLTPRYIASD